MAEPDFSITTPDWLKQGRDVGDEWLRMRADNRQQRELSLREREQAALLPLKRREAEQNLQLNGLRLADEFKHRDDMIQAELAAQQLAQGPVADLLRQGESEKALDMWQEAGARNPDLFKSKAYFDMGNSLRLSYTAKSQAAQRREMEEGRNTRAQEALDARALSGTGGFAPDNLTKLMAGRDRATAEGRTADAEDYQFRIDAEQLQQQQASTRIAQADERIKREGTKLDLALKEAGYTATPGPYGTMTLTPVARPLTAATVTDLQKSNAKLNTAIANVGHAIAQIKAHPEAFGPQGWLGEWKERFQGMVDPTAPMPVTGARTSAGAAAHDLIVSLRVDSQVSNFERKALDDVVGKPEEFFTNPALIEKKFQTLLEIAAARRIRQGKELRQPASPADLDIITDSEHIKSMAREGTLTAEEAIAWGRRHLPTQ